MMFTALRNIVQLQNRSNNTLFYFPFSYGIYMKYFQKVHIQPSGLKELNTVGFRVYIHPD